MTPAKEKATLDKKMKAEMALFKPGEKKRTNMDKSDDKKNEKNPNPGKKDDDAAKGGAEKVQLGDDNEADDQADEYPEEEEVHMSQRDLDVYK